MPIPRSGFFYNASGNTSSIPGGGKNNPSPKPPIGSFRVKDIILDEQHPRFKDFGEWSSIGLIFFEPVNRIQRNQDNIPASFAYPLYPNIKYYPLINEIVPIIYLADENISNSLSSNIAYYLPPINIWRSQVHNAIPSNNSIFPPSQVKSYQQIEAGSTRKTSDILVDINLGKTFNENNITVNPLYPYEGDIIYEGRFGNSIRLGSTTKKSYYPNPWSDGAKENSPIIILRNGQNPPSKDIQGNLTSNTWTPILEDINNDGSSIYLTSNQLPLIPSCQIQTSYLIPEYLKSNIQAPDSSDVYNGNQVILNSDRLVFNSKKDSIILQAGEDIHLKSNQYINIDGGKIISLVAPKVYLGVPLGEEGTQTQSPVMGDSLHLLLESISTFLSSLSFACRTATDSNGAAIASLNVLSNEADTLSNTINNFIQSKKLLSKNVKIS